MRSRASMSIMCGRRSARRRGGAGLLPCFVLCLGLALCGGPRALAQVATEAERAPQEAVGREGLLPVPAAEVEPGDWPIEVDSSSSMFRIVSAVLHVPGEGQGMTADLTLGGKGYLRLFMGTGEEALGAAPGAACEYREEGGAYVYTVPVASLNTTLECTGFSRKKEKWYDHQVVFLADTLPAEALRMFPEERQRAELEDGRWLVPVALEGGSGRASVESPALVEVAEGYGTARIAWSSLNYDYMLVNGEKLLPVEQREVSVFAVPVYAWDRPQPVVADTTAMSSPHEILYRLTFDTAGARRAGSGLPGAAGALLLLLGPVLALLARRCLAMRGPRAS